MSFAATESYSCITSIFATILLSFIYVLSLYVWRTNLSRDHPSTIKKRFFSVTCVMLIAPLFTSFFLSKSSLDAGDLFDHLGLRWAGFWQASILPLLLTMILFLGPLTMQVFSGVWKLYLEPVYWISNFQNLPWVRNHMMAPLSEEWVFRACMMPLLIQCLKPMTAVFSGPFLFGIAHFHHILEQVKSGFELKTAILISSFQFTYTTLFGAYSAYLFLRTGHFIAPLLAHVFCNHMGFPNFAEVLQFPMFQRCILIFNFILGLTLWCYLLVPMTDPELYYNKLNLET